MAAFKKGDFSGGIRRGAEELGHLIETAPPVATAASPASGDQSFESEDQGGGVDPTFFIALGAVALIVVFGFSQSRNLTRRSGRRRYGTSNVYIDPTSYDSGSSYSSSSSSDSGGSYDSGSSGGGGDTGSW